MSVKKNKICIIRRAYYPIESHVRRNAETLFENGFIVNVICMNEGGKKKFEVINGVNVYRLPIKARRNNILIYIFEYFSFFLFAFVKLNILSFKNRYNIIETDSMPDFIVFISFIQKLLGTKIILYLFESMPELWLQKRKITERNLSYKFLCSVEKRSCSFADNIICCHDMAKEVLVNRGINAEKITVVLNVPDNKIFNNQFYHNKTNSRTLRLVQHGTITENYGIQVVLQALAEINGKVPIHYDIIGCGEFRPYLERLVKKLKIGDLVTFHGFVSQENLLCLLNKANIGIVPMLFEYQSPNKMFELIALDKPIIISDRKTFLQYFDDEEVFYFKTGDSNDLAKIILSIYNNSNLENKICKARKKYKEYCWEKTKFTYVTLYELL